MQSCLILHLVNSTDFTVEIQNVESVRDNFSFLERRKWDYVGSHFRSFEPQRFCFLTLRANLGLHSFFVISTFWIFSPMHGIGVEWVEWMTSRLLNSLTRVTNVEKMSSNVTRIAQIIYAHHGFAWQDHLRRCVWSSQLPPSTSSTAVETQQYRTLRSDEDFNCMWEMCNIFQHLAKASQMPEETCLNFVLIYSSTHC